jgi:hypothetical protein
MRGNGCWIADRAHPEDSKGRCASIAITACPYVGYPGEWDVACIERFIGELRRQEGSSFHFRTVDAQAIYSEADRPRRPLTALQVAWLFIMHARKRNE